jgi:E3 ubiquitin-protein ligase MGRN1
LPCPNQYKFSEGLDQDFPPKIGVINPSVYKSEDLTEAKDDYFPVVLMIETEYPQNYSGKAKKSLQITYGKFNLENEEYSFQCIKQKFLFNNKMFDLGEIFGIEGGTANLVNDTNKLCVICFTNDKDTVVLPCRHMCLCMECSQIVRRQSNNCPICRTKVSTFIQIKDDQQLEGDIAVKKKPVLSEVEKNMKKKEDSKPDDEGEEEEEEDDDDLEDGKRNQ